MASADMENVFIRKDVFDARMDRMEMLLEKNLTEMRAENEKFRTEIRAENEKFRTEMKAEIKILDERINSVGARVDVMQTTIYWGFAFLTIVLAMTTFAPALLDFIKSLRKPSVPSVSLNEVQEMINSAIAKAMGMKQNS